MVLAGVPMMEPGRAGEPASPTVQPQVPILGRDVVQKHLVRQRAKVRTQVRRTNRAERVRRAERRETVVEPPERVTTLPPLWTVRLLWDVTATPRAQPDPTE